MDIKKSVCDICGNEYEPYAIILDSNPLSITSFLEDESREDNSMRTICKNCRGKEEKNGRHYNICKR